MIEGITEFLPISSTGHLTIAEKLLGMRIDDPSVVAFTAIIQIGASLIINMVGQLLSAQFLLRLSDYYLSMKLKRFCAVCGLWRSGLSVGALLCGWLTIARQITSVAKLRQTGKTL